MNNREKLARRLCNVFWMYYGERARTDDEQWERESRKEGYLALPILTERSCK